MRDILPVVLGFLFVVLFGLVINQLTLDFQAISQLRELPEAEIDEHALEGSVGEFLFNKVPATAGKGD